MNMIGNQLTKAFNQENLFGSYFTAPIKAYHKWVFEKIKGSYIETSVSRTVRVASGCIGYPILSIPAAIGVASNIILPFLGARLESILLQALALRERDERLRHPSRIDSQSKGLYPSLK